MVIIQQPKLNTTSLVGGSSVMTDSTQPPVRMPKYLPPGPPTAGLQPIVPGPSTAAVRPGRPPGNRRTGPSSHSPRAGKLPDGRELFFRKPNVRRNWEPVRDHFCESCGGLYPRTPFEWEDVGYNEDGKKLCALRKRCSGCTFPGFTQKLELDRSKAVEGYIRRLHPNFNLPVQLQARPNPVNQNHRNPQGHQVNTLNLSQMPQPGPSQPLVHAQPANPRDSAWERWIAMNNWMSPDSPLHLNQGRQSYRPPGMGPPQKPTTSNTASASQPVFPASNGGRPPGMPFPRPAAAQSAAGPSGTSPSLITKVISTPLPTPKPPMPIPSTSKPSTPKPSTPKSSTPKTTPASRSQSTTPSHEMFEALRRAFDRNPEPSQDVLELLAVTCNIDDVRVLGELFKVWRKQGKKTAPKVNGKEKDFESGSLEMNDQGTPDLSFGNGGDVADDLERQEREILQRIAAFQSKGLERDGLERQEIGPSSGVVEDGEIVEILDEPVSPDAADIPPNKTIAPHSSPLVENGEIVRILNESVSPGAADSPRDKTIAHRSSSPVENLSELRSNGLLDMLTSDDAMQVDQVEASDVRPDRTPMRLEPENGMMSGQKGVAHHARHGVPKQGNYAADETMQVIIPGMDRAPSSIAVSSDTNTPVSEVVTPTEGAQVIAQNTNHTQTTSARSLSMPVPASTLQPQPIPRALLTSTGPPARPPPPSAKRPKGGVTIVDCPVHEVKHMSDPILQRAYEIFTAPEPTRLANWLSVVFKPASEKYSVMQKNVYTEYKSVFEGSAEPCATDQQVVRMCLDIWPELKLGKRLDQPAQLRMWGLYRVRLYSGSPWEALYNGQLKKKLGLSNAKPIEMASSESGVLRVGARVDSGSSALSTARLDQGKMQTLSDAANKRDLDRSLTDFPIPDSLPTWKTKTTPKGAAVTTHRLSKLHKVYNEPVVRSKRLHPILSAKKEILRMKQLINPGLSNSNLSNDNSYSHASVTHASPSSINAGFSNNKPPNGRSYPHTNMTEAGPSSINPVFSSSNSFNSNTYTHASMPQAGPSFSYPTSYSNGQTESWQYANPPPFPQPR